MDLIQLMKQEHRVIEQVLSALAVFAGRIEKETLQAERDTLEKFIEFFREFADKTHHGKEEVILFEEMVKADFSKDSGMLGIMLQDHVEGRAHTKQLSTFVASSETWGDEDRAIIYSTIADYRRLLRRHIQKEDYCVFPTAESSLTRQELHVVNERFEEYEADKGRKAGEERLYKLAKELTAAFESQ